MGAGMIGGEVDLGFNPSFLGTREDFGNNSVLDFMGNVIVGVPIGGMRGVRPFATAGVGLLRRQIDGGDLFQTTSSNNDFGWNAGAGVMGFFSDHVGVRGDVRYLRTINAKEARVSDPFNLSEGDFHYRRAAIGVVIR
jgi:opacity protein-like surface antigen